ncbi:uncharacterized protein LOC131598148 [Vicia villosa]|uniref:uncharacterized protein LOC131598148 n=1 Tax=Vicia villosa TaxID=3911 RepID=UPI00273B5EED|nr:uncharacterized protein LOC131598148 [Vicia villosa]
MTLLTKLAAQTEKHPAGTIHATGTVHATAGTVHSPNGQSVSTVHNASTVHGATTVPGGVTIPGGVTVHSNSSAAMMSFYMKGEALGWFKWMHQNHELVDWQSFTKALELCFGPSTYANHQAELFKLKQTHSVVEYQAQFEKLGNQVVGLSRDALLNCFISGLLPEIQNELAIHKPDSISKAIGLAKLIESKLRDAKPKFHKPFTSPSTRPNPPIQTTPTAVSTPKPPTTPQIAKLPIRRLSNAQLQERRAQDLCFNCDEKFIPGHKCATAGKFLLLIEDDDVVNSELAEIHEEPVISLEQEDTYFQLSPQAANGQFCPKTLKFKGSIMGLSVTVLIDTGSTHNILQPRIAQHLKLLTQPIPNFSVMVGNGSKLSCSGICQHVPIKLQNNSFSIPFHLFPIEGADVVLGMEWLRTLGPLMADFSIPKISFTHNNTTTTITGDPKTHISPSSYNQFCHLLHTDSIASLHLLLYQPTTIPQENSQTLPSDPLHSLPPIVPNEISTILQSYAKVFEQPHGLPPTRPHDHKIPIAPNTPPINPLFLSGPISEKKDGTWRFCVDYRALNAVTICDRFPIPTIDELFDELGSATIFSKIDLRCGYHQIRVSPEDTHKTAFRTFDGHYEFLVMPFGLTNAPNHSKHLKLILDLLVANQFYAKLSKCVFATPSVAYLGHIISNDGVTPDPEKIKAILEWPRPRSLSTLRGFLGLTGFY